MDITNPKLTRPISDQVMDMEAHLVHDQLPFDEIWLNYPLQNHQITCSSSTQLPTISIFSDQMIENHHQFGGEEEEEEEEEGEEIGAVKEMMYRIAAMQPVDIDPSTIRKPKRRNVRISDDPQSVAARLRRERISEKIRILQRLVPGGTKLDTASMLDEAIRYVKFLKRQIRQLQRQTTNQKSSSSGVGHMFSMEWPEIGSTSLYEVEPGHKFNGNGNCELSFFQNEVID